MEDQESHRKVKIVNASAGTTTLSKGVPKTLPLERRRTASPLSLKEKEIKETPE